MNRKQEVQYSEQETQQRFEKLVRSALNTRPKPLKTMGAERRTGAVGEKEAAWLNSIL